MRCKICGEEYNPDEFIKSDISQLMTDKELCFECATWMHFLQENPDWDAAIIDGKYYMFEPNPYTVKTDEGYTPAKPLYHILFMDGRVVRTNTLDLIGKLPEWYPYYKHQLFPNSDGKPKYEGILIEQADYIMLRNLRSNNMGLPMWCPQPLLKKLIQKYKYSK